MNTSSTDCTHTELYGIVRDWTSFVTSRFGNWSG